MIINLPIFGGFIINQTVFGDIIYYQSTNIRRYKWFISTKLFTIQRYYLFSIRNYFFCVKLFFFDKLVLYIYMIPNLQKKSMMYAFN